MEKINIDDRMRTIAKQMAAKIPVLRNSITNNTKKEWGCLGQLVLAEYQNVPYDQDTHDFDLIIQGYKVEVKTKDRNYRPKLYYDASVSAYNTRQHADLYYFVSTYKPEKTSPFDEVVEAYLMGYLPKEEYLSRATFHKKGDIDPNASQRQIDNGGGRYHCDTYSLPYSELLQPRKDKKIVIPETV